VLSLRSTNPSLPTPPRRKTPKPPALSFQAQSIPTVPSRLLNKAAPTIAFPLSHSSNLHSTSHASHAFFVPALTQYAQTSTLRLFCEIRFLFLFFGGGRHGNEQVLSNVPSSLCEDRWSEAISRNLREITPLRSQLLGYLLTKSS